MRQWLAMLSGGSRNNKATSEKDIRKGKWELPAGAPELIQPGWQGGTTGGRDGKSAGQREMA